MSEGTISIGFAADFSNVNMARAALNGVCADVFGQDHERASDMVMAVNEAMNNAVEHTGSATVTVAITCTEQELGIFVISNGPPFDPVAASAELDEEDMMERDEGGYGLYLIRELVDRFEYEYRDAHNVWKMFKNINP